MGGGGGVRSRSSSFKGGIEGEAPSLQRTNPMSHITESVDVKRSTQVRLRLWKGSEQEINIFSLRLAEMFLQNKECVLTELVLTGS